MSGRRAISAHRAEDGFALVSVMAIMLIVSLVAAVGALAVVRSFDETNRARSSTNAFSAADAAIDVVTWRMNKQLVASEINHLDGLGGEALATLGCADLDAGGLVQMDLSLAECELDVPVGDAVTASCSNSPEAGLPLDPAQLPLVSGSTRLFSRNVICSATVRNTTRRIFTRVDLDVRVEGALASPTSLWTQGEWTECPSDPAAACPPA